MRAGVLFANEPLILNIGITGELGGLASRGVGLVAELNHFGGPFLRAGLCYVRGPDAMSRLSLGFAIFSIEWQHRLFADWEPKHALLFQIRIPIGIGVFLFKNV
jgi:hypothetical protein